MIEPGTLKVGDIIYCDALELEQKNWSFDFTADLLSKNVKIEALGSLIRMSSLSVSNKHYDASAVNIYKYCNILKVPVIEIVPARIKTRFELIDD